MKNSISRYPESKHGGKIKKRPFADCKNLPDNPPYFIIQACIPHRLHSHCFLHILHRSCHQSTHFFRNPHPFENQSKPYSQHIPTPHIF